MTVCHLPGALGAAGRGLSCERGRLPVKPAGAVPGLGGWRGGWRPSIFAVLQPTQLAYEDLV